MKLFEEWRRPLSPQRNSKLKVEDPQALLDGIGSYKL